MKLIDELIERVEKNYNGNFYWDRLDLPTKAFLIELCGILEEKDKQIYNINKVLK